MSKYWTVDLSLAPRSLPAHVGNIHAWASARRGDTWQRTGTLEPSKVIHTVTKHIRSDWHAIWYTFEFTDGTGASCPEDLGHGVIYINREERLNHAKV